MLTPIILPRDQRDITFCGEENNPFSTMLLQNALRRDCND